MPRSPVIDAFLYDQKTVILEKITSLPMLLTWGCHLLSFLAYVNTNIMQTDHKSVYQTTIKAPAAKVWDALTNPEIVKQYFFGSNMVTNWKVGSPILFKGDYEGKPYEDKGTVLEFTPNKSLAFSYLSNWSGLPDKPENYLRVSYQLKQVQGGTELTITQTNYDEEKAKHSEGNWKNVVDAMRKVVE